jgi:hypothetical protein
MNPEISQRKVFAAVFEVDSEFFFRVPPVIAKAARMRDQDMFTVKLTDTGILLEISEAEKG